jgi:N-acetylglucosamine kinase-like BadF-type ATPase
VRTYLGVDGGGSKTAFVLIDESGKVLASHKEGPAYHLEIGLGELRVMLGRGIRATLELGGISPANLNFAFFGLPAYGEDSRLLPVLDAAASPALPSERYRCGNDMVCGWAGALACEDGINVVAGTGSIAYGEYCGRVARAGGWGELFGDEGSAYWIARQGLTLFSRMSDGRAQRDALYDILRQHFELPSDLDLCAAIYGQSVAQRSQFARLSKLVAQAADAGDVQAKALFAQAANELADIINAVRYQLQVPDAVAMPLSYSGGVFQLRELLLTPLRSALSARGVKYRFAEPRLPAEAGAALYAARLSGFPLGVPAVTALESEVQQGSHGPLARAERNTVS